MADKVNITKIVTEYLAAHPDAKPLEVSAELKKTGIDVRPRYVANIKTSLKKAGKLPATGKATIKKTTKKAPKATPASTASAPAAVVASTAVHSNGSGNGIDLNQIRKVAQAVHALGGMHRLAEILDLIHEVGGAKKFEALAHAMYPAEDTKA